jgi:hypothetical protein
MYFEADMLFGEAGALLAMAAAAAAAVLCLTSWLATRCLELARDKSLAFVLPATVLSCGLLPFAMLGAVFFEPHFWGVASHEARLVASLIVLLSSWIPLRYGLLLIGRFRLRLDWAAARRLSLSAMLLATLVYAPVILWVMYRG